MAACWGYFREQPRSGLYDICNIFLFSRISVSLIFFFINMLMVNPCGEDSTDVICFLCDFFIR